MRSDDRGYGIRRSNTETPGAHLPFRLHFTHPPENRFIGDEEKGWKHSRLHAPSSSPRQKSFGIVATQRVVGQDDQETVTLIIKDGMEENEVTPGETQWRYVSSLCKSLQEPDVNSRMRSHIHPEGNMNFEQFRVGDSTMDPL